MAGPEHGLELCHSLVKGQLPFNFFISFFPPLNTWVTGRRAPFPADSVHLVVIRFVMAVSQQLCRLVPTC